MKKNIIFQIFKFGIVGFLAFLIDFGVLFFLTEYIGLFYLISAGIAFTISVVFNYVASMRFVFAGRKDVNRKKEFFIFLVLSLIGLGINQVGLSFLVERCSLFYIYAKIIVTIIVMIWNFISKKFFLEER